MTRIDRKHQRTVFAFFMALLMSCLMSFVITLFNVGLVPGLPALWLRAWMFAFTVAFPAILVIAPVVQRLVELVMKSDPDDSLEKGR